MLSNLILWCVLYCCIGDLELVLRVISGGQRWAPILTWTGF